MKREDIRIRDPFVFTENNKYYLLGTTGNDPWGKGSDLTLYVSYDLQTFEKVCVLVSDGSLDSYSNIWAPEMHKYNGNYYLIVSAYRADVGRGSFIFVSDSLDDNFKMLTGEYITPKGWGCLDATLFVYEHKPYLCFSNEWTTPITRDGNGSLFMAKLSDDLTEIIKRRCCGNTNRRKERLCGGRSVYVYGKRKHSIVMVYLYIQRIFGNEKCKLQRYIRDLCV